jgi:hypothetical protein
VALLVGLVGVVTGLEATASARAASDLRMSGAQNTRLSTTARTRPRPKPSPTPTASATPTVSPTPTASATPTVSPTPPSTPTPTASPTATVPALLLGQGPEADAARDGTLNAAGRLGMYTSWYNGPSDLSWMTLWKTGGIPRAYADGRTLHLVVFDDSPETTISTAYGTACGRGYALSDRFLGDMQTLADIWAGKATDKPLYVTMFTELQTYACKDNAWATDAATTHYYQALKDRYLAAMRIFHTTAPNARVSIGWGGWQTRFDDPATGAGRSMFGHFDDVMRASDFQSFQAMQSDSNVADIDAMTTLLGAYGPVMLAHWKPDNGSATVLAADVASVLTDASLTRLTGKGLFAISFMDATLMPSGSALFDKVVAAIKRYEI